MPSGLGDWLRVGLGLVLSGQLMLLSLALNLSTVDASTHTRLAVALVGLTALGVALLGPELWTATRRGLQRGDVSLEAMFLLAIAGGLGASLWGLWTGGAVFFEVVTVVLTVHAIGARLKERFWAAALARIDGGGLAAERATLVRDDGLHDVAADTLRPGDRVAVFAGGRIPADGVVVEGAGWLDTSTIDGALLPIDVASGRAVAGGALVQRGTLRVDLTAAPDDSVHRRALAALVEHYTRASRSHALVRRVTRVFAPAVALVALVAALAWTAHAGPAAGFRVGTAVLLVACPCGLGVATPVALWATASALGTRGVDVHRLAGLEALAEVRAVVLDKTGTLVTVLPGATWVARREAGVALPTVRRWVRAIEAWSNHPVAAALRGASAPGVVVSGLRDLPGGGLGARIDDGRRSADVTLGPRGVTGRRLEVDVDGVPAAEIHLRERLLDDAASLVDGLTARGLAVEVDTGDRVAPALAVPCRTGTTPADKAARIDALRAEHGAVAFVGDAGNDLPALAAADVAIAAAGASAAVIAHADLSIASPAALLDAIDAARALRHRLGRLLALSAAGNVVGIGVAAAGLLHPVLAAVLMAGSSLVVTLAAVPGDPDVA